MGEEAFGDREVEDLYQARDLLEQWVRYYNEARLHSALNYLRPVGYYKGNPEVLLTERKRKLKAAATRRKEVNRLIDLMKIKSGYIILARLICPKTTEALQNFLSSDNRPVSLCFRGVRISPEQVVELNGIGRWKFIRMKVSKDENWIQNRYRKSKRP